MNFLHQTNQTDKIALLKQKIQEADAIMIGAGSGLSTSAGYVYTGERFTRYFSDFIAKYHFRDMYEGGFGYFEDDEEFWGYWSRYVYINRYMDPEKNTYEKIYELVKDKDYFVLTTNVDHCFQKAGFDKKRLFYTQGDYGLFQCSEPCHNKTYDNEEQIKAMVLSQGFVIDQNGILQLPEDGKVTMKIPTELLPKCPVDGKPMSMNLRADNTFVQDEGWDNAAQRYSDFMRRHQKANILYIELGVGYNTPGIIKYNFWNQVNENPNAAFVSMNYKESYAPKEIANRSLCINGDIDEILNQVQDIMYENNRV